MVINCDLLKLLFKAVLVFNSCLTIPLVIEVLSCAKNNPDSVSLLMMSFHIGVQPPNAVSDYKRGHPLLFFFQLPE